MKLILALLLCDLSADAQLSIISSNGAPILTIGGVVTVTNASIAPINVGCIAWYKMDDGSGASFVDSTGITGTGTLTGGATWVAGEFGQAVNFNSAVPQFGVSPSIPWGTSYTVSIWFNSTPTQGDNERLVSNGDPNSFGLYFNTDTTPQLILEFNSTPLMHLVYVDSTWENVIVIVTPTNTWMYLNGVLVDTESTGTITTQTVPLYIAEYYTGNHNFNGAVDDVRVYNYDITAAQTSSSIVTLLQTNP